MRAIVIGFFLISVTSAAHAGTDFTGWLTSESARARDGMLANVAPSGTAPGAVVASPSRHDPNYFYHWVRDASLTMSAVLGLWERATDAGEKAHYEQLLIDFAAFSRQNQLTPNRSGGPGEPKFLVDGSADNEDWGRPQNDGPALRATTLARWALDLINEGRTDFVRSKLYSNKLPADSVIKVDAEYVSYHWGEASFDPWEECSGHHFYVSMVQRRALVTVADLAEKLGDSGAADWYRQQAHGLEGEIARHWDGSRGYLLVTLERNGGIDYKSSGLDSQVILAILHGYAGDGFFAPTDDRVLATARHIRDTFQGLYPINGKGGAPGVAIGRYPEDRYDGATTSGRGNPWVLATAGFGELHYLISSELQSSGKIAITNESARFYRSLPGGGELTLRVGETIQSRDPRFERILFNLRATGDGYLAVVRAHEFPDGSLSEQINRDSGFMQSAHDLTWSYASVLTASWAR